MHFGRRGRENLRTLRRTDFSVSTDGEGCMYVCMWRKFEMNKQRIIKMTAAKQRAECMK